MLASRTVFPNTYNHVIQDILTKSKAYLEKEGWEEEKIEERLHSLEQRWRQKLIESKTLEVEVADEKVPAVPVGPGGQPETLTMDVKSYGNGVQNVNLEMLAQAYKTEHPFYPDPHSQECLASYTSTSSAPISSLPLPPPNPPSRIDSDSKNRTKELPVSSAGTKRKAADISEEPQQKKAKPAALEPSAGDQFVDDLTSDEDEDDDEIIDSEEEEDPDTNNQLLCVYQKVKRVRKAAGWDVYSCDFKSGMLQLDGKDYLFGDCHGEFEWK